MLTVQFKEKIVEEDGSKEKQTYVIINGIADEESYAFGKDLPSVHLYEDEIIKLLQEHSFEEVGQHFTYFGFDEELENWENWLDVSVYCNKYFDYVFPRIQITLNLQKWEHWAKPWSIADLGNAFQIAVSNINDQKLKYWQSDDDSVLNGFGVEYFPGDINSKIQPEIEMVLSLLSRAIDQTNQALLTSIDSNSVLTYFQFPEEIKTACGQYLVYFTQFIADIGIKADTELKQEVNHTLFKITPRNESESLERIQEALSVYLNAPHDESLQLISTDQSDIAVKQWEANILQLRSQLLLATSIIQMKDATIETLQLSNYQYKQLLESNSKKSKDSEDIIEGVLSVTTLEGKGFKVNLAEILRRLKRKILS